MKKLIFMMCLTYAVLLGNRAMDNPIDLSALENLISTFQGVIGQAEDGGEPNSVTTQSNMQEELARTLAILKGGKPEEVIYAEFFDEIGMPASRKESILKSLTLAKQTQLEVTQKYATGGAPPADFYDELSKYSASNVVKPLLNDNEYRDLLQWVAAQSK